MGDEAAKPASSPTGAKEAHARAPAAQGGLVIAGKPRESKRRVRFVNRITRLQDGHPTDRRIQSRTD